MKEKKQVTVNRAYKDRVFCMLYEDKENLLSLYNAINGTGFKNAEDIKIVTLENAIFMGMRNDMAFLLSSFINMYEHQSTWSPNIPYRLLQYVADEYEKVVTEQSLYGSKLVKIPTPQFVVFYNGTKEQPDKMVLKLSDAYAVPTDDPELELKVTVYNINAGHNAELLGKCQSLREYAQFVEKTRKRLRDVSAGDKQAWEAAIREAVDECIREGILRDFLIRNKAEVVAMSIYEYDEEREKELLRKAEFEYGVEQGKDLGERLKLISQVCKKLEKGKTVPEIAEALEEEEAVIERICRAAEDAAPRHDAEAVLEALQEELPFHNPIHNPAQTISCQK